MRGYGLFALCSVGLAGLLVACSGKPSVSKELLDLCRSSDLGDRSSAAADFALSGAQAVDYVEIGLADASANCRWTAAGAAALLGTEANRLLSSLQMLKESDSNPSVRQMAQMAAHKVGGPAAGEPPDTVSLGVDSEAGAVSLSVEPDDMLQGLRNVVEKRRNSK